MEFWILHKDGPGLGQQPMNSRSKYDAYRRSHDGTQTTHKGHTMATQRRIEDTMRSNYVTKVSHDLPMV